VLNFLLKDNLTGGSLELNSGTHCVGDGDAYSVAVNRPAARRQRLRQFRDVDAEVVGGQRGSVPPNAVRGPKPPATNRMIARPDPGPAACLGLFLAAALLAPVAVRAQDAPAAQDASPGWRARATEGIWTRVDRKMLWPPAASSDRQRARVLTGVKARRYAPPPLRGADGLDAGSAHARPGWLLPTMPTPAPPTCCGRPPVQNDPLSRDR